MYSNSNPPQKILIGKGSYFQNGGEVCLKPARFECQKPSTHPWHFAGKQWIFCWRLQGWTKWSMSGNYNTSPAWNQAILVYIYINILLYKASFLETLFRDVVLSTALRPSLITHSDSSLSAIHPSSNWLTKIQTLFGRFKLPIVVDVCFVQSMFSTELWNVCYKMLNQSPFNVVKL